MDQLVFEEFIKKRSRGLVDVMENGILRGGVDWLNAGKPTGESRARGTSEASAECRGNHGFWSESERDIPSCGDEKGMKTKEEMKKEEEM